MSVQPTDLTDAYRVSVMALAVGSHIVYVTTFIHLAIECDDIVISDAFVALLPVP